MSLPAQRAYARRMILLFARRLHVPAPCIQFTFEPKPVGSATVTILGKRIVTMSHALLRRARWEIRAVAAHEVGHLRARHPIRQRVLSAVSSFAVGFFLCALLIGVSRIAAVLVPVFPMLLADHLVRRALYFGYEVEADRWAARAGGWIALRRLRRTVAAWGVRGSRWHGDVLRAVERA